MVRNASSLPSDDQGLDTEVKGGCVRDCYTLEKLVVFINGPSVPEGFSFIRAISN
jgi:hypothetical protein